MSELGKVCSHGSLARSCYTCELEAERDRLTAEFQKQLDYNQTERDKAYVEIERLKAKLELGRGTGILYGEGELGYLCNQAEQERDQWKAKAEKLVNVLEIIKSQPCHCEKIAPEKRYQGHKCEYTLAENALADFNNEYEKGK